MLGAYESRPYLWKLLAARAWVEMMSPIWWIKLLFREAIEVIGSGNEVAQLKLPFIASG